MLTAVRQVSEKEKFRIPYCVSDNHEYINHIFYHESYTYHVSSFKMCSYNYIPAFHLSFSFSRLALSCVTVQSYNPNCGKKGKG